MATNLPLGLPALWAFACGRGTHEKTRIRRLYSAVNARCCGFATTCTAPGVTAISPRASVGVSLPAPYSNFGGRDCLIHPGAEGGRRGPPARIIVEAFDSVDFKGKKVLDIGCLDGLWSFEAERRGAAEIVATDQPAG